MPLKRGDLFDIVLVQVKGGSASLPTIYDRHRLLRVKGYYHARDVVLFRWRRNKSARFYILGPNLEWIAATGEAIFG